LLDVCSSPHVCVFAVVCRWSVGDGAEMAVPLLTKKIVKKRVKQFKRPHLDRYKCLKV
jgi:hypothetical protein